MSKIVVKNQIANNVIKKKSGTVNKKEYALPFEKLSTLFQGPTFLIGMSSPEDCEVVFNIIKKQKKLGVYIRGNILTTWIFPQY